jgi:NAD(P)-dependent dehydrogenase (short-subunit alcohol dehydrogenase family)
MKDALGDAAAERVSDLPFAGKAVLVTGQGVSARCIAGAARDRGGRVALAGAHDDDVALDDVAYFPFAFDSEHDADRLIDAVVDLLARLDVIIVVVAAEPLGDIDDTSSAQWRRSVAEPLRRLFWLTRRGVEELLAAGVAARVVLVLDPAMNGERNDVVEDALRSFALSFAREYGSRALTCNVVIPLLPPKGDVPARAHLDAIVEHVLFFAAASSSFVNGETLLVDLRDQG